MAVHLLLNGTYGAPLYLFFLSKFLSLINACLPYLTHPIPFDYFINCTCYPITKPITNRRLFTCSFQSLCSPQTLPVFFYVIFRSWPFPVLISLAPSTVGKCFCTTSTRYNLCLFSSTLSFTNHHLMTSSPALFHFYCQLKAHSFFWVCHALLHQNCPFLTHLPCLSITACLSTVLSLLIVLFVSHFCLFLCCTR